MGRKKPKTSLEFVLKDPPKSVVTPFLVADLALLLMFVCHIPLMVMGELPANDILPAVLGLLGSMLAGGLILVWIARVNKRDFGSSSKLLARIYARSYLWLFDGAVYLWLYHAH